MDTIEGLDKLNFYVVRNKDGKLYRKRGVWVDKLDGAKFYNKIGYARATVNRMFKYYSHEGYSHVVEFSLGITRVIDVEQEVKDLEHKKDLKKKKENVVYKRQILLNKKKELERAEREYQDAQDNL